MNEELTGPQGFDPWAKKRKRAAPAVLSFPELGFRITLRDIGTTEKFAATQEAQQVIALHVEAPEDEPAAPFTGDDGQPYELNALQAQELCLLRQMQPPAERCSFSWWVGFAEACEEEYQEVSQAAQKLLKRAARTDEGNSTRRSRSAAPSSP